MAYDFQDDYHTAPRPSYYRVEQPPEVGKIFHVQVFQPMLCAKASRNRRLSNYLSVEAVLQEDRFERAHSARNSVSVGG